MHKYRTYIAYTLIIILAFPVLYQEVHKILHHVETAPLDAIISDNADRGHQVLSQIHHENCQICTYEFALYKAQPFFNLSTQNIPVADYFVIKQVNNKSIAKQSFKLLRAPPQSTL